MAYITKRGNSYSVRYTYENEHGKNCDKWESFSTKEEATNRKKQIEHELAAGTFLIPSSVTVAEFLMDWLPKQCSKHKWAPKTYESNLSTIQNLIIPYIGGMEMQKLKPYHMENLYTTLSKTPCGSYIEGRKQELTKKQKQRFLSGTTIHEVHRLLGTAFQYAVEWGILVKSPVPVDSPKKSTQERTIWTVEEMRAALDSMEDPILHLAVHLTLVGALREGEIVGLTPDDIDFDAADGIGTFRINKSMQRVRKEALNQVDDGCIIKIFPDKLERSTTSLILKSTKTASSCRTIFMTSALKEELKKWLGQMATDEMKDPTRYHDSGMLFRLPNGLTVEPVLIRKKFLKWQDAHPEFPRIVFHGLRHSSATCQSIERHKRIFPHHKKRPPVAPMDAAGGRSFIYSSSLKNFFISFLSSLGKSVLFLKAQHIGNHRCNNDRCHDRNAHGNDRVLEDRQRQNGGVAHHIGFCAQQTSNHTADSTTGHHAVHGLLTGQVDAVDCGFRNTGHDAAKRDRQCFGALFSVLGAQCHTDAGAALCHVVQDECRAEHGIITGVRQRLRQERHQTKGHTAHDQPRQASSQQTHGDKADLIAKEAKDNGQIVAQITAQRCQDRKAQNHRHRDGAQTDQQGLENSRYNFIKEFFQIVGTQRDQQGRQQRTGITHQTHRKSQQGDRLTCGHQRCILAMQQSSGTHHGVDRRSAQLLRSTIGRKDGHKEERRIGKTAQKSIGRSICQARIDQRDQQQNHLQHTACHQTRDQRGDRCRNILQHGHACALQRQRLFFCRSVQIFVDCCAFQKVKVFDHRFIHGQQVFPQDDHELPTSIDHAQNAGNFFQCFLICFFQILDHKAQTGHAMRNAVDVFFSANQPNDLRCGAFCIECHLISPFLSNSCYSAQSFSPLLAMTSFIQ